MHFQKKVTISLLLKADEDSTVLCTPYFLHLFVNWWAFRMIPYFSSLNAAGIDIDVQLFLL
jgi:hypothetical protein